MKIQAVITSITYLTTAEIKSKNRSKLSSIFNQHIENSINFSCFCATVDEATPKEAHAAPPWAGWIKNLELFTFCKNPVNRIFYTEPFGFGINQIRNRIDKRLLVRFDDAGH